MRPDHAFERTAADKPSPAAQRERKAPRLARQAALLTVFLALGVAIGGWLFSRTVPRSFLTLSNCAASCLEVRELVGLAASAGIQRADGLLRSVGESSECIAINHPKPEARIHIVFFPKRDVKNILELQQEDTPFVLGCFALARQLALREAVTNYRLYTNGPALQHVTYLHFHLVAK